MYNFRFFDGIDFTTRGKKSLAVAVLLVLILVVIGGYLRYVSGVRGLADPVSAEENVTDGEFNYYPAERKVEYPASYERERAENGTILSTTTYSNTSYFHNANVEAADVAAGELNNILERRVENESRLDSIGISISGYNDKILTVERITYRNREGEIISEPDIGFRELRKITPRYVNTTVHFRGMAHTLEVPVKVRNTRYKQL